MLEHQYRDSLRGRTDQLDEKQLQLLMPQQGDIPDNVWALLDSRQKVARRVNHLCNKMLNKKDPLLDDEDRLRMLYAKEGITDVDIQTILTLWRHSKRNESNPTIDSLIRYVINQRKEQEPVSLNVTHCITKNKEIKVSDFLSFAGQKVALPEHFIEKMEQKGWEQIRNMMKEAPVELDVNIYVGDQDFLTLDRCYKWCSELIGTKLLDECDALLAKTVEEANNFFGTGKVKVWSWMDQYFAFEVWEEAKKVKGSNIWKDKETIRRSVDQYKRWGYYNIANRHKIPPETVEEFRVNGEELTRAQYRIEANLIKDFGGIQCWTEEGDNMNVSNYDGAGLPPSLILTN